MMTRVSDALPQLLDANLLQLFVVLYDTRRVTRAAEQLNMAQPTVSIWLSRLRQQLNDPLFVRTPSGMQPTPVAEALIPTAREALNSLRRLSHWDAQFEPATAERRFCIAMSDVANITLLPKILEHVRTVAPHITLKAVRIDKQTAQAMESGEVDLAIGLLPELGKGFYQQSLFSQDWICLVAPQHPRIRDSLTLAAYEREAHIDVIPGTGHRLLSTAVESKGIARRVVLQLPGYLGLSVITRTTDLIATLPRQMGETLAGIGELSVFACPFFIPSFVAKQHWHARVHHDAANRWLRGICAELLQKK
ncbi:LysR family transcriptional regulator [Propionivibrio dicarboxylicus]|uniref:Transcriptional regulator, LysR family n=1 Tax=Propionivibrio dicarboxylicus TaxID=83767 RepID=A0A1G8NT23_9RHOO|nr:LysR family transcriptional regulator [Propionivibrio dicarboxylicus]SDI83389.1 transcriptional regulator, LysR family [Propionivibrio dicarboxylicus]